MHLRSQECGYISIYELELQHNIFINNNNKKKTLIVQMYFEKLQNTLYRTVGASRCSVNRPLYWYFSITLYASENMSYLFKINKDFA